MRSLAIAGGLGLASLAALFLARRVSGGIVEPLPPGMAIALSFTLAAGAALVRAAGMFSWLTDLNRIDRQVAWILFVCPGLASFVTAMAAAVPAASQATDAVLFVPLSLAEVLSLAVGAWTIRHSDWVARRLCFRASSTGLRKHRLRTRLVDHSGSEEMLPRGVSQRLVRRRLADGLDCCEGMVRIAFAPGQRTEVLHVAFCPPLEGTPRWTATVVDGPALTIKQVQVFPHGARAEVRLGQLASEPVQSVLRFQAVESRDESKPPAS